MFLLMVLRYLIIEMVAWDEDMERLCGGPGNPQCSTNINQLDWTRDAILAEMEGLIVQKVIPHKVLSPSSKSICF